MSCTMTAAAVVLPETVLLGWLTDPHPSS